MATIQQQARALGDPTRHKVFRYLAEAARPVGVAELTEHFGLNHNAIRQHLTKLSTAELVVETRVPTGGPGRPRAMFVVDPSAESRWGVTGPYERLSVLLSEILRTGESAHEIGRRAGERYRTGTAVTPDEVLAEIEEAMAREGFEPEVRRTGERVEVVLQNCPFASAAEVDPNTVCSLHRGIAEGVAGEATSVVVDELVDHDPREAGCRLCLHVDSTS
ncbi:MAG: helix-turn-helix domain-containing protein [Acidimicrobiia bacterium]|nr:helix-turn-helix domain-containing protein [Acidimicrobiia bacterium]